PHSPAATPVFPYTTLFRAPGRADQAAGADQRQAHQRRWVVVVDALQQRDAQAFAPGAAGAVVGLLGAQVALDLVVRQVAEHHMQDRKSTRLNSSHVKISYA